MKLYHKINIAAFFAISSLLLFPRSVKGQSCIGEQGIIEWFLFENLDNPHFTEFKADPSYPLNPSFVEEISNLATPYFINGSGKNEATRYNDDYGSIFRGFIKAPETGTYTFNVTSDDESQFFLSTDSQRANMVLRCEVLDWTDPNQYDKYVEQTSVPINLTQGEYYYFEAIHVEQGGGDHFWVHWKTPSNSSEWDIIGPDFIYKYNCAPICPPVGTACDDGDPNTENDLEDGNCHCMGTPISKPSCVGERGSVVALYYDTISNWRIQNLYDAPKYPLSPDRGEVLDRMVGPAQQNAVDNFGTRIRGYLRVPVSGNYIFNVTGDNEVHFMISPNETTTTADEVARNDGYAWRYDYYDKPEQTSDPIHLNAGQFYAIELVHKEQTGSEFFYLFWKTPFAQDTAFQIVNGIYLYQYACETACIPAGTPCDDGDANTFNDVYDSNCNCTGTPCADPACSNALGYTPYEPCDEETDRHSTNPNSSWLSCEETQSPNPERGLSHWIQYDFGAVYALNDADIWNYNAMGASGDGFQTVVIDYSLDGSNWSELGTFTWNQATGDATYTGFNMSDFEGISARYVLLTAIDNFSGSGCVGLSEISFNASTCPDAGEPCDDGNPLTINDAYNEFCYCTGEFVPSNSCDSINATINYKPIPTNKYGAQDTLTSKGLVRTGSNVLFVAGICIDLFADFEVEMGADFTAMIDPCTPESFKRLKNNTGLFGDEVTDKKHFRKKNAWLKLNPANAQQYSIEYNIPKDKNIYLGIYDKGGSLVGWILNDQYVEKGRYTKQLPIGHYSPGTYRIALFVDDFVMAEELTVGSKQ